jgi:sugar phosphate isomerase/epimerase
MSDLSRRAFVQRVAAGVAAITAGPAGLFSAARKKIPIGVQLYSVGAAARADLPGTLAGIKKIGYEAVEFAGYYNKSAKELRQLLDDNGLKACGSHINVKTMIGDELAKTIEFNQILGNRFLIAPSLPQEFVSSLDAWAKTVDVFNEIAAKLKPLNMHAGFHNHTSEFKPLEGQVPMEYFFGKASKDVVMQLDVGHCVQAGADPVALLKKFPGRALTVHVKEWNPTLWAEKKGYVVGEGEVKWPEVFRACETVGGTEWYIIEEETRAFPGLEGIDKSMQSLKKLLA